MSDTCILEDFKPKCTTACPRIPFFPARHGWEDLKTQIGNGQTHPGTLALTAGDMSRPSSASQRRPMAVLLNLASLISSFECLLVATWDSYFLFIFFPLYLLCFLLFPSRSPVGWSAARVNYLVYLSRRFLTVNLQCFGVGMLRITWNSHWTRQINIKSGFPWQPILFKSDLSGFPSEGQT